LAKKAKPFTLKKGTMYKVGQDAMMRGCLTTLEAQIVLKELHEGLAKIHFVEDIIVKKKLDASYWWHIHLTS
jgi:hypothetical protein